MEGYLTKKPDPASGKKKWSQYWFVLNQGRLSRYDLFDVDLAKPTDMRDAYDIANAIIKREEVPHRRFCFSITFADKQRVWILEAAESKIGKGTQFSPFL